MSEKDWHSFIRYNWIKWEWEWGDFSAALRCLATGLGWFVGLLTISWVWASLTVIGVVLLVYNRGLNQLIDRKGAYFIILKAGFATNLVIAPLNYIVVRAPASAEMVSEVGVKVLLLSFGVIGLLWFLWKVYYFSQAIARERETKWEDRTSLVDTDVLTIFLAMIGVFLALVWGNSFTDLRLVQGFVGVLAGLWLATGCAFLWVTLRRNI